MVIVGGGFAGARAAVELRRAGYGGRVVIIGDEAVRPYDRVTLSKHYLWGEPGLHGLFLHDDGFYPAHDIELVLGTPVELIDPSRRDVRLTSGRRVKYDALLLATGSDPVRWRGRGHDLGGVHYLRTLADADRLREALATVAAADGSVVVVGFGWIGGEIASAAGRLGCAVEWVGRSAVPLQRQIGRDLGAFYRDLHRSHGVGLHPEREVTALTGPGRVEDVMLDDGTVLPTDLVVFGIGARPRTAWVAAAGVQVDDGPGGTGGIITDEHFATTVEGIFAAGDAAAVWNTALGRRSRPGHWSAALVQGPAAARAMLGSAEPYAQIPFFFSDQYDVWMEYTGDHGVDDELVVRHIPATGSVDGELTGSSEPAFIACWLREGMLTAGMNVNVRGVPDTISALIAAGRPMDREALADPRIPLAEAIRTG